MLIIELISWWYSGGLLARLKSIGRRYQRTLDNFSLGLLVRTLFKPFRQIDSSRNLDPTVAQSINQSLQHFTNDLISRFVGFWARLILLISGLAVLIVQTIFSLALLVVHLAIPLLPFVGLYLTLTGKVPPDVGV
jgi:hypothetical protein